MTLIKISIMVRGAKISKNIPQKKEKGKPGRIGHYKDDFLRQVYLLAKLGARNQDIAAFFNVDLGTVEYWTRNKPDFVKEMKRGKWEFDFQVVETLGRRALGYDYVETETAIVHDKFGNAYTNKKTMHKKMAPDVTAIIFWLKNRQRELWSDVNKHEITATLNLNETQTINIENQLTKEERELIRSISIKKLAITHGVSSN